MDLIRDPDLEALLPAVSPETHQELESQLLTDGRPRDPIYVWKGRGIIVDGHRRHAICARYGLPFDTVEIDFPSKDDAKLWMLRLQRSRRNLTPHQEALVISAINELRGYAPGMTDSGVLLNTTAQDHGVTKRTIYRANAYAKAFKKLPAEIQKGISEKQPAQADVIALSEMPPGDIRAIWREFSAGEFRTLGAAIRGESTATLKEEEDDEHDEITPARVEHNPPAPAKDESPASGSDAQTPSQP